MYKVSLIILAAIFTSCSARVDSPQCELQSLKKEIDELKVNQGKYEEKAAEIFRRIIERLDNEIEGGVSRERMRNIETRINDLETKPEFSEALVAEANSSYRVAVSPNKPTHITFSIPVLGGLKMKSPGSLVAIQKSDSAVTITAKSALPEDGELILVHLRGGEWFPVNVVNASSEQKRDKVVTIKVVEPEKPSACGGTGR